MDIRRVKCWLVACSQMNVTRGGVFFVYMCYDYSCFMLGQEVASGNGI
jgi:hypothetical protein